MDKEKYEYRCIIVTITLYLIINQYSEEKQDGSCSSNEDGPGNFSYPAFQVNIGIGSGYIIQKQPTQRYNNDTLYELCITQQFRELWIGIIIDAQFSDNKNNDQASTAIP